MKTRLAILAFLAPVSLLAGLAVCAGIRSSENKERDMIFISKEQERNN